MVPWTWGWELWLHLLMLHTRGTVSPVEVTGRCLPLALPQHVFLPGGLIVFHFLVFLLCCDRGPAFGLQGCHHFITLYHPSSIQLAGLEHPK